MSLGAKLIALRQAEGLTQEEVALGASISRNYLSQLENERRGLRVPRVTVLRLAAALGVASEILLREAGMRLEPEDIDPEGRLDFQTFVLTEPTLTEWEQSMIIEIYDRFMQRKVINSTS